MFHKQGSCQMLKWFFTEGCPATQMELGSPGRVPGEPSGVRLSGEVLENQPRWRTFSSDLLKAAASW
jgi:hypothetical protein